MNGYKRAQAGPDGDRTLLSDSFKEEPSWRAMMHYFAASERVEPRFHQQQVHVRVWLLKLAKTAMGHALVQHAVPKAVASGDPLAARYADLMAEGALDADQAGQAFLGEKRCLKRSSPTQQLVFCAHCGCGAYTSVKTGRNRGTRACTFWCFYLRSSLDIRILITEQVVDKWGGTLLWRVLITRQMRRAARGSCTPSSLVTARRRRRRRRRRSPRRIVRRTPRRIPPPRAPSSASEYERIMARGALTS
eukprot:2514374-Pyramimonas_sp.AAC.1